MIFKVFLLLTFNKHQDLHGSKFHRHLKHTDSATPGLVQWSPPCPDSHGQDAPPRPPASSPRLPPGTYPGPPSAWHPWCPGRPQSDLVLKASSPAALSPHAGHSIPPLPVCTTIFSLHRQESWPLLQSWRQSLSSRGRGWQLLAALSPIPCSTGRGSLPGPLVTLNT